MSFKFRSFINVEDIGPLEKALAEAQEIKNDRFKYQHLGKNKTLLMIFFNNSLRTRLSTQKAAMNLGMNVIVLDVNAADVDFVITHPEGYELDPKFVGNQQFVILPDAVVEKLSKTIEFTHWGQAPGHRTICRFVTSWATTEEELDVLEKTLNDAH